VGVLEAVEPGEASAPDSIPLQPIYPLSLCFSQLSGTFTAMAEPNLQEIHDFLMELAKKAGDMITSANPSTIDTKKNCKNLVPLLILCKLIH